MSTKSGRLPIVVVTGLLLVATCQTTLSVEDLSSDGTSLRKVVVALVQLDAVPEAIDRNLAEMERLSREAVERGAQWIQFHEGCVMDYTPRVKMLVELVTEGKEEILICELEIPQSS